VPAAAFEGIALEGGTSSPAKGEGCSGCRTTGYSGRIGVFELLTMTDAIRDLVINRAPASLLKSAALQGGFVPLRQAGLAKVAAGVTTLEEVYRVTQEADGE
jgi:type II secretory ATPase GspE/PulE/Tfp pilus assembly ATPase PilB-like protein